MHYIDSKKAAHLLRPLPYEKWMSIGILQAPKGMGRIDIGSLDELLWSIEPSVKTLSAVRFEKLEAWLRDSVEDSDFADEVQKINAEDLCYIDKSRLVYEAAKTRVSLLKQALGEGGLT